MQILKDFDVIMKIEGINRQIEGKKGVNELRAVDSSKM
jgi:hypothetical protein